MSHLIHTGTLELEEFALAGDGFRECGVVPVALDIEMYDDGDWQVVRAGFLDWNGRADRTWWLGEGVCELALQDAIIKRAHRMYESVIADFVRSELREVA